MELKTRIAQKLYGFLGTKNQRTFNGADIIAQLSSKIPPHKVTATLQEMAGAVHDVHDVHVYTSVCPLHVESCASNTYIVRRMKRSIAECVQCARLVYIHSPCSPSATPWDIGIVCVCSEQCRDRFIGRLLLNGASPMDLKKREREAGVEEAFSLKQDSTARRLGYLRMDWVDSDGEAKEP